MVVDHLLVVVEGDIEADGVELGKKYFGAGYTQKNTKECDEYPFQSTYEGAARWKHDHLGERNNFSVMPVKKAQNGAAGILLAQFYDKNRILDGPDDGFLVKIIS
ncbi:hypothetical protein ABT124_15705 [Streptomyces sp. NPDC001982]|uniref:NucA/NucB deoxyribonuclease domain-containing protein n=1 Tax=Streptomyces sp. NPDC001982 TaxID=3154405 RepID=UPI003328F26D